MNLARAKYCKIPQQIFHNVREMQRNETRCMKKINQSKKTLTLTLTAVKVSHRLSYCISRHVAHTRTIVSTTRVSEFLKKLYRFFIRYWHYIIMWFGSVLLNDSVVRGERRGEALSSESEKYKVNEIIASY